ncbi:MAG: oxygen-independent coproporphyrinogen III oxidase [Clostridia bacterium]|jgi:oxygen-independent coproporphyrinogen-3 oxidase|nr:oxygen-independent coproporphyrinogen III oxidase [Clostridia bacterium]
MKNKEIGIYVHIPFCKKKCDYCDFISYCNKDNLIEPYIEAVKKEIQMQKTKSQITTIYIGGGTPSYIESKYIEEIIEEIKKKNLLPNAEITIEVNPETVTKEKLRHYKKCGINRISIGLQTTKDELLKKIGRIHNYEKFIETYKNARKEGFKNINVDLILGLPTQRIKDLKDSLQEIIELKPEHISVYSLIVEEGTPIANKIGQGKMQLPEEELERNMYWYVKNTLELNNYIHYEISNFAKKGYESKHNMNCWNQQEYIGIGVAAHSYRDITRYSNIEKIDEYIKNVQKGNLERNRIIHEIQKEDDTKKEFMILGLREIEGIKINEFKNRFGDNPIYLYRNELNKLVKENLVYIDDNIIKLTNKGIDFANLVWEEFV